MQFYCWFGENTKKYQNDEPVFFSNNGKQFNLLQQNISQMHQVGINCFHDCGQDGGVSNSLHNETKHFDNSRKIRGINFKHEYKKKRNDTSVS